MARETLKRIDILRHELKALRFEVRKQEEAEV